MRPFVIGTRGSALALRQTELVLEALRAAGGDSLQAEIRTMRTEGDRRQDVSLEEAGGQGVFVKDIEAALVAGDIDIAVHSLKDMPPAEPAGLTIGAVLERGDPRDALVSQHGLPLASLPAGARIGTDSQRRSVQLKAMRPDIEPMSIRGNVDTRVRKAMDGEYDAVCLAVAGLERLGLLDRASQVFSPDEMLPAVGQAVLAVQCRAGDSELIELLTAIDDAVTRAAITAERAFLMRLGAGCRLPVAAYGVVSSKGSLQLSGLLATPGGRVLRDEIEGSTASATEMGFELADRLISAGSRSE